MQIPATAHTVTTVFLRGEFDITRGNEITDRVAWAIDHGAHRIAVDLAEVTFADCYTVGRLVSARQAAALRGVETYLTRPDDPLVRQLLEITGVLAAMRPPAEPDSGDVDVRPQGRSDQPGLGSGAPKPFPRRTHRELRIMQSGNKHAAWQE